MGVTAFHRLLEQDRHTFHSDPDVVLGLGRWGGAGRGGAAVGMTRRVDYLNSVRFCI